MLTLWDLIKLPGASPKTKRRKPAPSVRAKRPPAPKPLPKPASKAKPTAMQQRYEQITREMLRTYGVRVRKWRTSMSGVAWQVTYQDGSVSRLLEAPKPRGPMSAAIFLHEIGHHAIGFHTYKPRCLEEYHAWRFAIVTMHELGLNVTDRVHQRMYESLQYALGKAQRRGIKSVPPELAWYLSLDLREIQRLGNPFAAQTHAA